MSFDDSGILDVTAAPADAEVIVSWASSSPAGTVYQVYQDGRHVWSGAGRSAHLPRPTGPARYQVGAVGPGEDWADFSGSLPVPPGGGSRLTLAWQGGLFLSPALAGYSIYLGTVPGGAVNYAAPVGKVAAYGQASVTNGYGQGGYGAGGYGNSSASYSWQSGLLRSGTWNAAIIPYDRLGNTGTPATTSAVVAVPPGPVPRVGGQRVAYSLNRTGSGGYGSGGYGVGGYGVGVGSLYATLGWAASPGI